MAPSQVANALAEVLVARSAAAGQPVDPALAGVVASPAAQAIASSLASGEKVAILLGNLVVSSPLASQIAVNASALAQASNATFGFLTEGGNTVGGYLAGAIPGQGGLSAQQMLDQGLKSYLVLHAEPAMDAANGARAVQVLKEAGFVVALTAYRTAAQDWADVMLPVSPFTETSGTFVNAQGVAQSFKGAAAPLADTRPAWKVLRVMGNLFQLEGFEDESSESVRDVVLEGGIEGRLSNQITGRVALTLAATGLERIADVPIYRVDAIVRRSEPLQATTASSLPQAYASAATLASLNIQSGDQVKLSSDQGQLSLAVLVDDAVADQCVRVATAFKETLGLGASTGLLTLERV